MTVAVGGTGTINLNSGTLTTGQLGEGGGSGGGTVTFDRGILQLTGNQAALFDGFEAGDVTLASGGGTIDTQAFTVGSSTALSGAGGLIKQGTGSLTLTGANTYAGDTAVRNGTLGVTGSITHPAADMKVGQFSGDDGTLEISGTGTVSSNFGFIGRSSDSTGLAKVSGGSWTNSGQLLVGFGGDGTLEISGTGAVSNTTGFIGVGVGSTGLVKVSGDSWTNSSNLYVGASGDGTLEISGGLVSADSVILARSSSSTGNVALSSGILATGQVSEGAGTGGGTFEFDGGTLLLKADQADLFSGFEAGDVTLAAGGGTIDTQAFTVASGTALSGVGGLTKQGTGSLTLSGVNTYASPTSVRNGTLVVTGSITHPGSNLTVGQLSGDDGTLEISGTGAVSNFFGFIGEETGSTGLAKVSGGSWTNKNLFVGFLGDGNLEISGGQVTADSVFVASGGSSSGSATLTGGTLTTGQLREGAGTGTVTFDHGTLQLSADQAALFTGFETGDVTLAAPGGTIDTQAFTVGSAYALSGAGRLSKMGTGSLTLDGANTYTGATDVDAGSLYVEGSLANTAVTVADGALLGGSGSIAGGVTVESGGTLAPGSSPGILTVGSLDLLSGSTTAMELNGLTPGTQHDQVVVNGTANLDGTLDLDLTGGFFANGDSFTLIDADAINNDFASINYLYDLEIVYGTEITDDYIFTIIAIATDFASLAGLDPELAQIAQLIDDNFADAGLIPITNELNLLMGGNQPTPSSRSTRKS